MSLLSSGVAPWIAHAPAQPGPLHPGPLHPGPLDFVDGRRCTVQMANGYLYLDAAATPAHALLGHDRPDDAAAAPAAGGIGGLLDELSPDFICAAVLPDLAATVDHARRLLRDRGCDPATIEAVDAADGEPQGPGVRIAVESASLGRSGRWLASEGWRHRPALVAVGEPLSRGLPFGAVLAPRHGSGGRPFPAAEPDIAADVASAVGLTVAAVREQKILDAVPFLADYLRERLRSVQSTCPAIEGIAFGPFRAVVALRGGWTAASLKHRLCERGVLVGADGGRLVIAPPLVIRPAEIDVIAGALRGALNGVPTWRLASCCPACESASSGGIDGEGGARFMCA